MLPLLLGLLVIAAIVIYQYKTDPDYFNKMRNSLSLRKSPSATDESQAGESQTAVAGGKTLIFALVGGFVGGFIGFLIRPSAPLIGQLPFETVIARGSNLRGLDSLLVSTAQTSFNLMLGGIIVGGIAGIVAATFYNKGLRFPVTETTGNNLQFQSLSVTPKQVELNQSPEQVINVLGQPQKIVNLGAKIIYDYGDMKVIFVDGKVNDVQY